MSRREDVVLAVKALDRGATADMLIGEGWSQAAVLEAEEYRKVRVLMNGQAQAGPSWRLNLIPRSALRALPTVEPGIGGLTDRRGNHLLYGPKGAGKTHLGIAWAYSTATGTPWVGATVHHPGPVLYWIGEGVEGFDTRLAALESLHGAKVPDDRLMVCRDRLDMCDLDCAREVARRSKEIGAVGNVFDSLSRAISGREESGAKDMSLYVQSLTLIAAETGGNTLTLHNLGRAGLDPRGSSVLEDGMEWCWRAEGEPVPGVNLHCTKRRHGARPPSIPLIATLVEDSLVLTERGQGDEQPTGRGKLDKPEVLAWARSITHPIPLAKSEFSKACIEQFSPVSSTTVYDWLNRQVEAGRCRSTPVGNGHIVEFLP